MCCDSVREGGSCLDCGMISGRQSKKPLKCALKRANQRDASGSVPPLYYALSTSLLPSFCLEETDPVGKSRSSRHFARRRRRPKKTHIHHVTAEWDGIGAGVAMLTQLDRQRAKYAQEAS